MTKLPALIGLLAALFAAPASAAAAMYRCGNHFQDRPCADTEQQQVIKPGRGAAAPQRAASAPKATPAH
ncbi:MAG TPA: DUF4124 domain-containing protein [Ramlibacter sp.]|uniref:DUF4124 domain-containing protein n=1 Tax=Ramlibacter sp. TaxID=1917967 RepID=UPI002ECFCA65